MRYFSKFVFTLLLATSLHAQEKAVEPSIHHSPLKSSEIPAPGVEFTLSFDFSEIPGTISRERLFVVRDGKLLDVKLLEGIEPGTEALAHNAVINAPLVEMKYWALAMTTTGEIYTSPSYTLRRKCMPNLALSSVDDPPNSDIQERLKRYLIQAKALERDLEQYEQALALLEPLVGQMKEEE